MLDKPLSKKDGFAREILLLSRNLLIVHFRFLDTALNALDIVPGSESLAVDGQKIFYNADFIFREYREEKERIVRNYFHMVLHCVFRHEFVWADIRSSAWNLACDMAVENIMNELNSSATLCKRQQDQGRLFAKIAESAGGKSAEILYHFIKENLSEQEIETLSQVFAADDHTCWYPCSQKESSPFSGGSSQQETGTDHSSSKGTQLDGDTSQTSSSDFPAERGKMPSQSELEKIWKEISEKIQMDLEVFSKAQGDKAGGLIQNLREINRERVDYRSFLKKFAHPTEVMKVSDDEFDYVYYTYGLRLFDRMPLIEPLEYKEAKRIKEFVIVIDTSGSVSGDLVQTFIEKTYQILKQEETFSERSTIYIIQCDTTIQEAVKITSQAEFDAYLKTMTLKGFGGTDFRPAFQYVDDLIERKQLLNLKGLIYFSDGYGIFPNKTPAYQTAFVFIDQRDELPEVPPWVIRIVFSEHEITEMKDSNTIRYEY